MNMIDWERSHPDDIHDISVAYGIDVAWKCFLRVSYDYVFSYCKSIFPQQYVPFLFSGSKNFISFYSIELEMLYTYNIPLKCRI